MHVKPATTEAELFQATQDAIVGEPKVQPEDGIPHKKQFFSLGMTCSMLHTTPVIVRKLAAAANVKFALAVDDVPFFDADGLLAMNHYLEKLRGQIENAATN